MGEVLSPTFPQIGGHAAAPLACCRSYGEMSNLQCKIAMCLEPGVGSAPAQGWCACCCCGPS